MSHSDCWYSVAKATATKGDDALEYRVRSDLRIYTYILLNTIFTNLKHGLKNDNEPFDLLSRKM